MTAPRRVYFFVNGGPRLLMAAVIGQELYPDTEKHVILLDQFGYNYENLLPVVGPDFSEIHRLPIRTRNYSHLDQLISCYFGRYSSIRKIFEPNSDVILFGLRSPAQKFIIRLNRALGNRGLIFAESLAVDRYFTARPAESVFKRSARRLLSRAFEYQHDYDAFHLFCKAVYGDSPFAPKLEQMFDLFSSSAFRCYAEQLTSHVDIDSLRQHDLVLLGQPLSNFDDRMERSEEEAILRSIVGERKVLILPHPNEILGADNKYGILPNATVLEAKVPSDLILSLTRPKETITYSSTIGITYAISNPNATSRFYPIDGTHASMLHRFDF